MSDEPLIAVVHSTTASISPTAAAFAAEFPGARLWNLLDDRLGSDAETLGGVTPPLRDRMLGLVRHGIDGGADAVLMVCSMYGDTVEVADKLFLAPVTSSDADMMDEIVRLAPRRVAVLASLHASAADSTNRLHEHLAANGAGIEVVPVFCDGAAAAAAAQDRPGLVAALAAGVAGAGGEFDLLCIAQYSLSPVHDELAAATGVAVVSPPRFAARSVASKIAASNEGRR
ncbi:hypothetical protein CH286_25565 [Rhodococcus sp. WWJCD1]|uniref:hypothetical protein n=1 Tax=unclassified Rhodococcus (in: high G+C Gram-positive bacteria) TaxID=192944 RepID=UPI000B9C3E18|nr:MULTISPECIES: hypothetical protein [unclassified Rhodococcus (in: high G+C Gram-positive bacteria)]OZC42529.1 hypothetical protein CH286_25565 [Rhodococcus sp. WWJCD1]OZE89243.1 hypothetical protein CH302_28035 [Rhodococcus sp. 15-2388-1-1a]